MPREPRQHLPARSPTMRQLTKPNMSCRKMMLVTSRISTREKRISQLHVAGEGLGREEEAGGVPREPRQHLPKR